MFDFKGWLNLIYPCLIKLNQGKEIISQVQGDTEKMHKGYALPCSELDQYLLTKPIFFEVASLEL